MQFSLVYGSPKDYYDNGFVMGSSCNVYMKKSKICPKLIDIPCVIDASSGGIIDEIESFMEYLAAGHINIIKTGAYYSIKDTIDLMIERYPNLKDNSDLMCYYKSIRRKDLVNSMRIDKDLTNFLQIRLIDLIDDIYPLQRQINGDYQIKLMKECKYFDNYDYDGSNSDVINESIVEG